MKNLLHLLLLVTVFSLSSCYNDNEEHLYGLPECGIELKSFANDVEPILANTCSVSGCHDGTEISLITYEEVFNNLENIKNRINSGSMPPSYADKGLAADELIILNCWIDEGGIDN